MRRKLAGLGDDFGDRGSHSPAQARITRLVVEHRENIAGAYEKLTGHAYGELDPANPLNSIVTDIEFAPRNARGMVEYAATFTILKPVDASKASGVMAYLVPTGPHRARSWGWLADYRRQGHILVASAGRPISRARASKRWSCRSPRIPMV